MRNRRNHLPVAVLVVLGFALAAARLAAVGERHTALAASAYAPASLQAGDETRLAKGYRFERGGWIYVHLEGTPFNVGYQHGYLLAPEIADAFAAVSLEMTHETGRNWDFFRRTAHESLWHGIDPEYQQELRGIVAGLQAKKVNLDLNDIVAMNAFMELPDYYVPWLNSITHAQNAPKLKAPEACSAFVATGSWTKDGRIVMGHNDWTSYVDGERWRIIFDIVPEKGNRILMDGFPGVIVSDDDFAVNSAGLMVTETTISDFHGWDPTGRPEFERARKAMQYANSIDDFVRIINDGNNGGYANDWLLGDRKTGEVARFEEGLKHTQVWRTKDGYFAGSNFPSDPEVIKDETTFDTNNLAGSANARHVRWDQLMAQYKGKIDTKLAEQFESDHYDTFLKKVVADRRTLCGHGDVLTPGDPGSEQFPYHPSGAVQGKVTDSSMAAQMSFIARIGHPCGENFKAAQFLQEHPAYSWEASVLRDMDAGPWTQFHSGEQSTQ